MGGGGEEGEVCAVHQRLFEACTGVWEQAGQAMTNARPLARQRKRLYTYSLRSVTCITLLPPVDGTEQS